MTTMNVKLPDSLVKQAQEMAEKEEVTLDQLVSSALAEKVAAWRTVGYLQARGARGDRERFEKAMSKVPDLEPDEHDRL
jgi:predicted transcriptional regulator